MAENLQAQEQAGVYGVRRRGGGRWKVVGGRSNRGYSSRAGKVDHKDPLKNVEQPHVHGRQAETGVMEVCPAGQYLFAREQGCFTAHLLIGRMPFLLWQLSYFR